jgi:hypothetical protein
MIFAFHFNLVWKYRLGRQESDPLCQYNAIAASLSLNPDGVANCDRSIADFGLVGNNYRESTDHPFIPVLSRDQASKIHFCSTAFFEEFPQFMESLVFVFNLQYLSLLQVMSIRRVHLPRYV